MVDGSLVDVIDGVHVCSLCVLSYTSGSGIADIVVVFAESMRRPLGHHTRTATWEAGEQRSSRCGGWAGTTKQ